MKLWQESPQPRRCRASLRQTVQTYRASVHQAAKLVAALLRAARVTAGLAVSNGSLPPGLWLTSPAGWLQKKLGSALEPYSRQLSMGYLYPVVTCSDWQSPTARLRVTDNSQKCIYTHRQIYMWTTITRTSNIYEMKMHDSHRTM